jgi:hypothetical protein
MLNDMAEMGISFHRRYMEVRIMAGTLVAVFENHNGAAAAADALIEAKVPFNDIVTRIIQSLR